MTKYFKKIIIFLTLILTTNSNASFFRDVTSIISDNPKRLSYGVSVTDVNQDGNFDFIVTGFGYLNLALSYDKGKLINIINRYVKHWVPKFPSVYKITLKQLVFNFRLKP